MKVSTKNRENLAAGLGLTTFGVIWLLSSNFLASIIVGFGIYLLVKGVLGNEDES